MSTAAVARSADADDDADDGGVSYLELLRRGDRTGTSLDISRIDEELALRERSAGIRDTADDHGTTHGLLQVTSPPQSGACNTPRQDGGACASPVNLADLFDDLPDVQHAAPPLQLQPQPTQAAADAAATDVAQPEPTPAAATRGDDKPPAKKKARVASDTDVSTAVPVKKKMSKKKRRMLLKRRKKKRLLLAQQQQQEEAAAAAAAAAAAPKKKKKKTTTKRKRAGRFEDVEAVEASDDDSDVIAAERDSLTRGLTDADIAAGRHMNPDRNITYDDNVDTETTDSSWVVPDHTSEPGSESDHRHDVDAAAAPPPDDDDDDDDELSKLLDDATGEGAATAATRRLHGARRKTAGGMPGGAAAVVQSKINEWSCADINPILADPTQWSYYKNVMTMFRSMVRPITRCNGDADMPVDHMLQLFLKVARFTLTPEFAGATDVQMLHVLSSWPDDISRASLDTYKTLNATMRKIACATGANKSPFNRIFLAIIAPVVAFIPMTMPEEGEEEEGGAADEVKTYHCAWTRRALAPGDPVWLCASYDITAQNKVKLFYIGQHQDRDVNIKKLRAMRTCHRWPVLFAQSVMEWQLDARFPDSCSADMRMARFLGEGLKAQTCCASALANYFGAWHIVYKHCNPPAAATG